MRLGSGPQTVVCLHGICLDNLSSWYLTAAPALAPHCTLVLYDMRGQGRSEQPGTGYTLEDSVLDVAAILDELGLGDRPVTLAGNSYGGLVALSFALRFPGRTESLVLVDAQAGHEDFLADISTTLALEGEARDEKLAEYFGDWLERHRVGTDLDEDARLLSAHVDRTRARRRRPMERVVESLVYDTSFVEDVRQTQPLDDEQLARVSCPVLAIYGEDSELLSEGERLAAALPNCTLEVIPGCAHFVILHETERLRESLIAWITGERLQVSAGS